MPVSKSKTFGNQQVLPSIKNDSSSSSDLKLVIKQLDCLRTEKSKIIDTIKKQRNQLDLFEVKFTEIFSQISLIKNENVTLRNDFLNLTKRMESLESSNSRNPISNEKEFSDFIDWQAKSKNIIIFNIQEPTDVGNADIITVNRIIEKFGVDVKPVSIICLGKPNNKFYPLKVMFSIASDVSKILGVSHRIKTD